MFYKQQENEFYEFRSELLVTNYLRSASQVSSKHKLFNIALWDDGANPPVEIPVLH